MPVSSVTKKEYRKLLRRQEKTERDIVVLKKAVQFELLDEKNINPARLKRWERISRDMDHGKGKTFSSVTAMRQWLKKL